MRAPLTEKELAEIETRVAKTGTVAVDELHALYLVLARGDVPRLIKDLRASRAALRGLVGWRRAIGFGWNDDESNTCVYCRAPFEVPNAPKAEVAHRPGCPVGAGIYALPPEDD